MSAEHPVPAGLRLVGKRLRLSRFVVFVRETPDAGEVRVRVHWRPPRWLYICDEHGPQDRPRCPHSLAAAQLTRPTRQETRP